MNQNPIGLFDSGIGGTSIWTAINQLMPHENTIYLADSQNAPYGQKTKNQIIELSIKNTQKLLDLNAKIIVVACNTATTNAITTLRQKFKIPFIGIEPAIKPAANQSKTQTIGILATQGTLSSELFNKSVEMLQDTKIIEQIGHGIVELIENGNLNSPLMTQLLQTYLQPMIDQNIDYLVLGCSHYPYLIPQIQKIIPKNIQIIDSGNAVAKQTQNILKHHKTLNTSNLTPKHQFFSNANPNPLTQILQNKYPVTYQDF